MTITSYSLATYSILLDLRLSPVSLSDNLEPFEVNQSVALVVSTENHGLAIGDEVNISIFPDDATKTKNYLSERDYIKQQHLLFLKIIYHRL